MLLKVNVIYSKIFSKNKLWFVIEKIKLNFLNYCARTYFHNITATMDYELKLSEKNIRYSRKTNSLILILHNYK
jgi:hypothetical protein